MIKPLYTKYRPKALSEVVGQADACSAIQRLLDAGRTRSFLFCGPSGVGKTTISRIIAKMQGVRGDDIIEVDAATRSGVDQTRDLANHSRFRGIGKTGKKVIIVDEAHQLSRQAWDSLLKPIEEPPDFVTWILCTTEVAKVPKTIQTRCALITLRDVSREDIGKLVKRVAKAEGIVIKKEVSSVIAECAMGSPRRALVMLELAANASSVEEAYSLLDQADPEQAEAISLCRLLMHGSSWAKTVECLRKLENTRPESIRRVVLAYFTTVAMKQSSAQKAERALSILAAFSEPYPNEPGLHPLLLSLEQIVE